MSTGVSLSQVVISQSIAANVKLMVLSTYSADGRADASPRGDAPGFVRVVDDRTLLIPDRRHSAAPGHSPLQGSRCPSRTRPPRSACSSQSQLMSCPPQYGHCSTVQPQSCKAPAAAPQRGQGFVAF